MKDKDTKLLEEAYKQINEDERYDQALFELGDKIKDPKFQKMVDIVHGFGCKLGHDDSMWSCDWNYGSWNEKEYETDKVTYRSSRVKWALITLKLIEKLGESEVLSMMNNVEKLSDEIAEKRKEQDMILQKLDIDGIRNTVE